MAAAPSKPQEPAVDPGLIASQRPLPLSASQENQVKDLYYKRVRTKCADEVRDFASCATARTFTAPFVCRAQRNAMNTCMNKYATQAEQDAARNEWFATRDQRRKERELKEEKRKEQEKFHREWWGLDEQGKRILNKGEGGGEERKDGK